MVLRQRLDGNDNELLTNSLKECELYRSLGTVGVTHRSLFLYLLQG